jgi:hypothetical protein
MNQHGINILSPLKAYMPKRTLIMVANTDLNAVEPIKNNGRTALDATIIFAIVVLVITAFGSLVDLYQTRTILSMGRRLEAADKLFQERGDAGEQIGGWLMNSDREDKLSNLEVMGAVVGSAMAKSMKASIAGEKSGDVRLEQGIEKKFQDYMKQIDPNLKDLSDLGDLLGVAPEHLGILARIVQRYAPRALAGGSLNSTQKDGRFEY